VVPMGSSGQTDIVCCKRLLLVKRLDFLESLQQLLGGQPFQQATVTLQFKIASKMAAIIGLINHLEIWVGLLKVIKPGTM